MSVSLSTAALILFIGIAPVIPHAYNSTFTDGYFRVQDAVRDMNGMAAEQRGTSFTISGYSIGAGNLTFTIQNTGVAEIDPVYVNVLVDGIPVQAAYDSIVLFPVSSINATVSAPVGAGEHRIKIVSLRGNTAYAEVNV